MDASLLREGGYCRALLVKPGSPRSHAPLPTQCRPRPAPLQSGRQSCAHCSLNKRFLICNIDKRTRNHHGQALLRQGRLHHLSRPVDRHDVAAGRAEGRGAGTCCRQRRSAGRLVASQTGGSGQQHAQSRPAGRPQPNRTNSREIKAHSHKHMKGSCRAERRASHVGTPASHACFSRSRQPPCMRMEAPARASMPFLMPPRMPAGAPAEIV